MCMNMVSYVIVCAGLKFNGRPVVRDDEKFPRSTKDWLLGCPLDNHATVAVVYTGIVGYKSSVVFGTPIENLKAL